MLNIKDLHVSIEGKKILNGLNLSINKGEVHALMGPNGSGKSTLSYFLSGKDGYEIEEGSIDYNGKNLLDLKCFDADGYSYIHSDRIDFNKKKVFIGSSELPFDISSTDTVINYYENVFEAYSFFSP